MNNQEAKFILRAYRSNGGDANDAVFAEALQQAQQDPTLKAWLASQHAMDAVMAAKLKEIIPPAGLREAILTGAKVSSSPPSIWRQTRWISLGAAAALLIVTSVAVWPKRASAEYGRLTEFALRDTASEGHGSHGGDVRAVQAMLGDPALRLAAGIPLDFDAMTGKGCRTVQLDGHEVFEVCFNRGGAWFHLYGVRPSRGAKANVSGEVAVEQRAKFSCATWSDPSNGVRYALVGDSGVERLKQLL